VNTPIEDEVLATVTAYLAAFNANDIPAIDRLMHYPLAFLGNGTTALVDAYPGNPARLMATKGWHTTRDAVCEVVMASAAKAHVILRSAARVRADGSLIETVSAFYALTRTDAGWKIFAISSVVLPA
jgi:hypothetical protein